MQVSTVTLVVVVPRLARLNRSRWRLLMEQDYSLRPAKLHVRKHADWHRDFYCEQCLAELNRTGRCVGCTTFPLRCYLLHSA